MNRPCERCGFWYEETEGVVTPIQRCPQCRWRQLLSGPGGELDEKAWEEEETSHRAGLPEGVVYHLCSQGRKLVEVLGPTHCVTYVDSKGQKHTLWEGRHFDLEVWEYWIHPNPLIDYDTDRPVTAILIFEHRNTRGATHDEVEVYGSEHLSFIWNF